MKKFKYLAMMASLICGSLFITSCGDSDDEPDDGNHSGNSGNGGNESSMLMRPISVSVQANGHGWQTYLKNIKYLDGLQVDSYQIVDDGDIETVTFTYNDNSIVRKSDYGASSFTVTDGLITKQTEMYGYTTSYNYREGYIQNDEYFNFVWKDGVVTKQIENNFEVLWSYSSNEVNVWINSICDADIFEDFDPFLVMQGYFGKTPLYFPSLGESFDYGESDGKCRFTYEFNSTGYPTVITTKYEEDGYSETVKYKITWENY